MNSRSAVPARATFLTAQLRALRPRPRATRGAYTKTLYVDDMDMHALGADVSAGRTFWGVLTPYVGLGTDLVLARETSDAVELENEALSAVF